MHCTKCGYKNQGRALFCARCGSPVKSVDSTQPDLRAKRKSNRFFPVIIGAVSVMAFVIGIVRFALGGNNENAPPVQSGSAASPGSSYTMEADKTPEAIQEAETPRGSDSLDIPVSDFEYHDSQDGGVIITDYKGEDVQELRFPDTIDGKPVVGISGKIASFSKWTTTSFTSAYIPDTVKEIDNGAFARTDLESVVIPDSVTKIGQEAFSRTQLISIEIPVSVTDIGNDAFSNCTELTSVTIPDSVTSIGDNAFSYCIELTSIEIPDSVTYMHPGTFSNCSGLTSVTIGSGLGRIQGFNGCSSLTDLVLNEGPTQINAFNNCTVLTSVKLPDSVTEIDGAFENCSSLANVTFGENTNIVKGFSNCSSLTELVIPDDMFIPDPIRGCTGLRSITIGDAVSHFRVLGSFNQTFSGTFPDSPLTQLIITDSATEIPDHAFRNCSYLSEIVFPKSIMTIGVSAFQDCVSLTSVTIPDGVTVIRNDAFLGCRSLVSVSIGNSKTGIGSRAFSGCPLNEATKHHILEIESDFNFK